MSCLALVRVRAMCAVAAIGALIAAGALTRTTAQQLPRDLPAPFANGVPLGAGPEVCGTLAPATEAALRFRPRRVLQDSSPISFD